MSLVMQSNIPSNLQANIKQVRPAGDKKYTKYYIEAITFNLSNRDKHLWNDMITVLSANFGYSAQLKLNSENWIQIEPKTNKE